tara:strand:+ start:2883 stop:3209 length:327 start_codon:yes stop_codon:yes gene_type:complete
VLFALASNIDYHTVVDNVHSPDHGYYKKSVPPGTESSNKAFTYFVVAGAGMGYAGFVKHEVTNFLSVLSPSLDVMAMANMEFDLSVIACFLWVFSPTATGIHTHIRRN